MEHRLGQVRSVVMGFLEGRLESLMEEEREEGMTESLDSSEAETLGASGNRPDNQDGGKDSMVNGVFCPASMRWDSPLPREEGLITQMEREAVEAGLGGWFNRNPEDVLVSHMRITSWIFETITNILAPEPGWKTED